MKFIVCMKDPDALWEAARDAALASVDGIEGLSEWERDSLADAREEEAIGLCRRWFEYGEYVSIEIDTDKQTAKLLEVER